MDSALCLGYAPLPTLPLHFHSNKSTRRRLALLTKPQFSCLHFPSLLSFRLHQRPTTSDGHVVFAMDRLPKPASKENKGAGNDGIVRGTVGASLVLACAVAMMGCSSKLSPKACAAKPTKSNDYQQESLPPEITDSLLTPRGALKSLFDIIRIDNADWKNPWKADWEADGRPSKEEVDVLKTEAVRLMKAGKCEEAETLLRDVYQHVIAKSKKGKKPDYEPAYNVEMALVEILIARGKYKDASKCNCLGKDSAKLDARFGLYKAILRTMVGDDNKAAEKYFTSPPSPFGFLKT